MICSEFLDVSVSGADPAASCEVSLDFCASCPTSPLCCVTDRKATPPSVAPPIASTSVFEKERIGSTYTGNDIRVEEEPVGDDLTYEQWEEEQWLKEAANCTDDPDENPAEIIPLYEAPPVLAS